MRARILWLMVPFLLAFTLPAAAASYTITISANSGGTVLPKKGKIPVESGGTQAVTFQANDGYYLATVKVDKVAISLSDNNTCTYTFTDVQQNHKISATFAKDPFIIASSTAGGTVDPKGNVSVPYGEDKTFTITPDTGHHLTKVLVDGVALGANITQWTFTNVQKKHSLKAFFSINTYPVTTQVSDGGKITPASLPAVKYGQTKTFTVTPSNGMKIASLAVNGVPVTDFPSSGSYKLNVTVTGNTLIEATFAEIIPIGLERLKGTYNLVETNYGFWQSTSGEPTYVNNEFGGKKIKAVFNGKGGCFVSLTGANFYPTVDNSNNQRVDVSKKSQTFSNCTYTVNDTVGSFALTINSPDGTEVVNGWVSKDGNSVVIGGASQQNDSGGTDYEVQQTAGVKAATAATKSSLSGTYHLVQQMAGYWQSTESTPTNVSEYLKGQVITATFNGNGECSVSVSGKDFNRGMFGIGAVNDSDNSFNTTSCSYTVAPNGLFTITLPLTTGGTEKITGWASADANVVIVGGASQNSGPDGKDYEVAKTLGVKAGANMTNAGISGTYKLVGAKLAFWQSTSNGITSGPDVFTGDNITATFDGSVGCTISASGSGYSGNNGTGVVTVLPDAQTSTACTYSVDPDGAFTIDSTMDGNTEHVTGWASADGSAVVFGGPSTEISGDNTGYWSELTYGVKTLLP